MIRLGVVGVGSFGEKRADAAARVIKGKLIGVADVSLERARDVAQKLGVKALTVEELLAHPQIDVVCISVPNKFHAPLAIQALEYGKHVMCEKPLARSAAEAEAIVRKAEACGRVVNDGSNHRYLQSVAEYCKVAMSGASGEPVSFNGWIANYGERLRKEWFWDREMSGGGTLLDNGCHLLDIARWMLGDFVEGTG